MRWVSLKSLQRDSGLSWMVCESIIREQTSLVRKSPGGPGILLGGLYLCSMLWALGAIGWLLPSLPQRWGLLLRLPGLVMMVLTWFVLPRLLAGDAILAVAHAHVDQASVGTSAS
ncbi:MAG TPA: hypothetical protein VN043_13090 [Rhodanobacter sp.]|nr:hypothetical protein [Rhodanobacter sp.]